MRQEWAYSISAEPFFSEIFIKKLFEVMETSFIEKIEMPRCKIWKHVEKMIFPKCHVVNCEKIEKLLLLIFFFYSFSILLFSHFLRCGFDCDDLSSFLSIHRFLDFYPISFY